MPRPKGYKHSEETKKKISESHIGLTHSEETRKKLSESHMGKEPGNKGKKASDETCKKMSVSAKKRWSDPEQLKLNSERSKKQWEDPEYREWYCKHLKELHKEHPEWAQKAGESNRGKHHSEETRKKMSASQQKLNRKGIPVPIERKIKISKSLKGRTGNHKGKQFSDEWCKHLSDSHKGLLSKEKNPNWKGGISYEPYCPKFNNDFKEYIRDKFGRKCFLCGKPEEENITKLGNIRKLSIHHVDYDKNDICNGYSWPFVPLCNSCHSKTNRNRWYWFNLLINYWLTFYCINFEGVSV